MAMMTATNLTKEPQNLLRCDTISTASKLGDILVREGKIKSAFEEFYGHPSPLIPYLIEFGRIGYVTRREQIQKKWTEKAIKCIMVGYAEDHTPDTYRLHNPQTNEFIMSRDVSWASWNKTDPSENMEQYADIIPGVPLDDPNQTTTEPNEADDNHEPTQPHIIPQ